MLPGNTLPDVHTPTHTQMQTIGFPSCFANKVIPNG